MEFQQDNSYVFYSALRGEMVYLFGPLVLSSWTLDNCVEIVYVDGRNEQILLPFSNHMMIDDGGGMEEEKENEEEEQPNEEEEQVEVAHPVTPQAQPNNEDDEDNTDNEDDEEEPDDEDEVEP